MSFPLRPTVTKGHSSSVRPSLERTSTSVTSVMKNREINLEREKAPSWKDLSGDLCDIFEYILAAFPSRQVSACCPLYCQPLPIVNRRNRTVVC